ncbi:MAG: hypothetical protein CMN45_00925 [SAR116 cluster bacterium]|nr:hypothetical protein [SAR116 cluster bacterium]
MTTIREGSMERSVKMDMTTGEQITRFYIDGGVFGPVGARRIEETGTTISSISDRVYRIHPDDQLCAKATMDQECIFERETWKVKIKTTASMTADKTYFYLDATVTCFDGDETFHDVTWQHKISRKGM